MTNHLIIGASGQVGEYLVRAAANAGFESVGTYQTHEVEGMRHLDIRNEAQISSLLEELQPTVVYLPASLANVDYCELHPEEGYAINVEGVRNVVQAVNKTPAKLVYFSSDYVFDGKAGPYAEEDPTNPICEYGVQKVLAEHYVALHARDYIVVRTTVVYGWERQGKNFIYRLLNTLTAGEVLRVPVDQVGSPTYSPDLSRAVVDLAISDAQGVYHVVGPELANRYEFACEAAKVFGLDTNLVQPVTTEELRQTAKRPLKAGMKIEKVTARLMRPLIGYREGLRVMASERRAGK
ncbi:MAG: NAD(P)-dependent oxidoreductase [Chloroflexota bacterium]|nr:NAD(P)-dependent oxidoreductase [Chloroflexota bacterium]MDQ5865501.1 NAD(P)-dependent oxidoreductase [Chloroflexota bacterium]